MKIKKEKREPRKPIQTRGKKTAEKIIQAGKRVFESQGYHGCTSKDIAKEADVGIGTLYGYFKDKKYIFIEVIDLLYEEITQNALTVDTKDIALLSDPKKLVSIMIDRIFKAHTISPDLHREITSMYYSDKEIHAIIEQKDMDILAKLKLLLTFAENKLKVTDLEAAAYVVYRSSDEIIHRINMFTPFYETKIILEETKNMIYKYLFT
jgi:AcrR family transcriptional regulator